MSIEKNIERIANALEALVESKTQLPLQLVAETTKIVGDKPKATKPKADKPAKEEVTEKEDNTPVPSVEDVRKVATDLVKGGGKAQLGAILSELGADNLSSIAPADRPKVIEMIEAAIVTM